MPNSDNYITIYKAGDPSTGGFLVKNSEIIIEGEYIPQFKIELDNLLLGVVELFLSERKPPPRIFDLKVSSDAIIAKVEFTNVLDMAKRFEFGSSVNRFLAILVDKTNQIIHDTINKLPAEFISYRKRAQLFADLVNRLYHAAIETEIGDCKRLTLEKIKTELYRFGSNFGREKFISQITYSKELEGAAERLKKNQVICKKGDSANCMYVLLEGSVVVSSDGKYLATISLPGECFGELSFFLHGKRTADLIATDNTALLRIDNSNLKSFHASHTNMFIQIGKTLAQRLQQNFAILKHYQAKDASVQTKAISILNIQAKEEINQLIDELKGIVRVATIREINNLLSYAINENKKL